MKLLKKLALLTTCIILTSSVLAGCGKENEVQTNNQDQAGGDAASTAAVEGNTIAAVASDLGCIDAEAFAKEIKRQTRW